MTALWLTATYATTALLIAVRIGRRLRNQGDHMAAPELTPIHDAMKMRDVRKAAFERIGEFGIHDEEEWHLELLTSDGDNGSDYDGLRYAAGYMVLAAMPAPEFDGEDHL